MNQPLFHWRRLALVTCVGLLSTSPAMGELKPGDKAPDFQLTGSDGKVYRLSDFQGKKVVVLAWYPKAFTGGWTKECKSFRENGQALQQFDVAYFTASCDPLDVNQKFAESLELDYPILSDPDGKVATAFGVVDSKRKFPARWTFFIGKDGLILAIDKQVDVAKHGADVVAKLEALKVAKKAQDEKAQGKQAPGKSDPG